MNSTYHKTSLILLPLTCNSPNLLIYSFYYQLSIYNKLNPPLKRHTEFGQPFNPYHIFFFSFHSNHQLTTLKIKFLTKDSQALPQVLIKDQTLTLFSLVLALFAFVFG